MISSPIFRQLKSDLFTILDRFVEQAAILDTLWVSSCFLLIDTNYFFPFSDDSWRVFLKRYATSVRHITGQEVEVKALGETSPSDIIEQELESLRLKVEELSDEVNTFNIIKCTCPIFSFLSREQNCARNLVNKSPK